MTTFAWLSFLTRWSDAILDSGIYHHLLTPDAYTENWLGEPGATEAQISNAETRLNVRLPPSYRAFLKTSNGWAITTPKVGDLLATTELQWAVHLQIPTIAWFQRNAGDDPKAIEFLAEIKGALAISNFGDTALYLLNPKVIDPMTGEWEAWHCKIVGGTISEVRYPSFQTLMEAEYTHFAKVQAEQHATQPHSEPLEWRTFLTKFSQTMLARHSFEEEFNEWITPEQRAFGWLGVEGASEEQIAAAEARLGMALPPSYRAFLKVSNGWSVIAPFVYRVYPVEEIGVALEIDSDQIRPYIDGYNYYGARYEPTAYQTAYNEELRNVIALSEYGDAMLLLNPKRIDAEGEMEAWFFASWVPGEERYASFQALMEAQYERLSR